MDYQSNFDIDLKKGQEGELLVEELAKGNRTIEVKRDYIVSRTGNLAVEVSYRGKPSGLSTTEAEWWAFVLDGKYYENKVIIFIETNRLKQIVDDIHKTKGIVKGGDSNQSQLVLVPVEALIERK